MTTILDPQYPREPAGYWLRIRVGAKVMVETTKRYSPEGRKRERLYEVLLAMAAIEDERIQK